MSVRNLNLGGSDYKIHEGVWFNDLNDTFNAFYDLF